ncbi:Nicotinamide-nucleotide adenylyltransferase [Candidatus Gugararchaeum adminiculabundum]|nr:Nicotinamide-nucleotide adenylyltransferase [Candidatus Gugararchaeum adminiculabundum]
MKALFVGRFQPFHNGHLKAIQHIAKECGEVIVLVGSSQKCYEVQNPFTVGERIEMIDLALKEAKVKNYLILSIPDIANNALWVNHVDSLVPHYDVVYSNNSLTKKLFEDDGKTVRSIPFHDRAANDGTKIRRSMPKNDQWKKLVPPAVAKFIVKIKGVERVRSVGKTDKYTD